MGTETNNAAPTGRPRPGGGAPRRDVREWRAYAACGGVANLFYKSDFDSDEQTRHRVTEAKAVCKRCPVRPQCAAHALAAPEPYGIWGGFTESERLVLLKMDWRRYADRQGRRVDVTRLQTRLREIRAEERAAAVLLELAGPPMVQTGVRGLG
jgi:WhiB family transcriptional regulator, redox-sensing transcriptional regulator